MRRRTIVLLAVVLSAAHFAASAALFLVVYSLGMDRFDSGEPPSVVERSALGVLATMQAPLAVLGYWFPVRLPATVQFGVVIANSLLWGFGIAWLIARPRRARG